MKACTTRLVAFGENLDVYSKDKKNRKRFRGLRLAEQCFVWGIHISQTNRLNIVRQSDYYKRVLFTRKSRRCVETALRISQELEAEAVKRLGKNRLTELRHSLQDLDATLAALEG